MNDILKIIFNDDSFTIFYITDKEYNDENEYKDLFKFLNTRLIKKYNYAFNGFYDVTIYHNNGIYILDFDLIDNYVRNDFNVMIYLNTSILYEFYDSTLFNDKMICYNDNYYVEIEKVLNNINIFEFGNIIYGKEVEKILNKGKLIYNFP